MKAIAILTWAMMACSANSVLAAEKYALLIGITQYEHARMNDVPLKYPEDDARAIGDLLQKSGYTVKLILGKEANQAAIQAALEATEREGSEDGVVIVGLFGHGVQYGNDAYFGPYNTKIRKIVDFKGNVVRDDKGEPKLEPEPASMISMRSILDTLTVCGAGSKVLLADCCRETPNAARGRAFGSNLQKEGLPRGMAALFACSENEQAFEHPDWGHGAFTQALLDECRNSSEVTAASLSDLLYRRVSRMVKDKTNGREQQTVNGIVNGFVDLRLQPSTQPVEITNSIGMKLRLIPAGEFLMGRAESNELMDELTANTFDGREENYSKYTEPGYMDLPQLHPDIPIHRVRISRDLYFARHEVTYEQFDQFVKKTGYIPTKDGTVAVADPDGVRIMATGTDGRYDKPGYKLSPNLPVTNVSWHDAQEFCSWLSRVEKRKYRLPTEAEWEYACRAQSTTLWSHGNEPGFLKKAKSSKLGPLPVGSGPPNAFGLFNMHDNVREWCSDWVGNYTSLAAIDPVGPASGTQRVLRGGDWSHGEGILAFTTSSARPFQDHPPESAWYYIGFRVVGETN